MPKTIQIVIAAIVIAASAWPQASTATVGGTVRDQSGAVIANSIVALTNTETSVIYTTRTNGSGVYLFPGVNPGPYRLTAVAAGMQKYQATLEVLVAQRAVIDPVLSISQNTTSVQVTDATSVIDVENATFHNQVDHARIEQLPINQRDLMNLTTGLPGEEGKKGDRVFGLPSPAQEYIVDGAVVTDRRYAMSQYASAPGLGAIQEFRSGGQEGGPRFRPAQPGAGIYRGRRRGYGPPLRHVAVRLGARSGRDPGIHADR